ncbi:MAG: undecaprenyl-diphosphate phosphatase [Chloroflexota bacterium]
MTWIQAIALALLQGVSELFPISSLGHTVVVTSLLGWGQLEEGTSFLPFVVLLHVGTAAALLTFFWWDWVRIVRALVVTAVAGRVDADPNGRLAWLVVAGTIPAGLIGLFLEQPLRSLFASPAVAATFLIVNGGILLAGERLRRRAVVASGAPALAGGGSIEVARPGKLLVSDGGANSEAARRPLASMSLVEAVLVGLAQALALVPGISRSGVTMVAGLLVGMSHEDSATFAFLLATPIIGAAGLLEVPQLFATAGATLPMALVGGVVAGLAAYLSVRFLMGYFETGRLDPFGVYCLLAGVGSLALIVK